MNSVILIDANIESIKVAVTEEGRLAEFHVAGSSSQRLVGNIYKGKVVNVLPGMHAAFVNYGGNKNGYLSADDILVDKTELFASNSEMHLPGLSALKEGDMVMVQVVKDENGTKGARLSQHVSLPGRFAVLLPTVDYLGISRKIEDEPARAELAGIIARIDRNGCGVIVRTAAAEASARQISSEIKFLMAQWDGIKAAFERSEGKELVFSEGDLAYCAIRDLVNDSVQKIVINDAGVFASIEKQMASGVLKRYAKRLELYGGGDGLFDAYNVNPQIEALLGNRVELENKAYIVIDKTEAMTVVDVNTGAFIGDDDMEQTAFETNLIAAREIARQLRLRNTGGIIVIDFIDMALDEHNNAVVDYLKKCLKADRTKTQVLGMTALGLVEMTRKKQNKETAVYLTQECIYCKGAGRLYSAAVIVDKIRSAVEKIIADIQPSAVVMTVNPMLVESLFGNRVLSELCETDWQGKRIYVVPDEKIHMHSYKIQIETKNILDLPENAMLLY